MINIKLPRIMGGDIRIDPAGFDIGIRDSWKWDPRFSIFEVAVEIDPKFSVAREELS
ncbi:MAG: hypothetical protein WD354_01010 [Acidimicrobiia bacterium]